MRHNQYSHAKTCLVTRILVRNKIAHVFVNAKPLIFPKNVIRKHGIIYLLITLNEETQCLSPSKIEVNYSSTRLPCMYKPMALLTLNCWMAFTGRVYEENGSDLLKTTFRLCTIIGNHNCIEAEGTCPFSFGCIEIITKAHFIQLSKSWVGKYQLGI